MVVTAKASHPGCLGEGAPWVGGAQVGAQMGAMGLQCAPSLARSWISGWVRSSEEGMKRGDAVFMPGGVFGAGRGPSGLGVRRAAREDAAGTLSPVSYLVLCFAYWAVPLIEGG